MRATQCILLVLCCTYFSYSQETRSDRFFGTLQIGEYRAFAEPFDGGMGGFNTEKAPINADVVVMVQEGQNLTWEWIGIRPGTAEKLGLPNVTLEVLSSRAEFTNLTVDLNPTSTANLWAGPSASLQYDRLAVEGSYSSFSFESEFAEVFQPSAPSYGFAVTPTLNYSRFPDELEASVRSNYGQLPAGRVGGSTDLLPRKQIVLEPKLEIPFIRINGFFDSSRLLFTPTGDANNDGNVSFDDFIILSSNFGQVAAAKWEDGDFDDDGAVGFPDFLSLSANFGTGQTASVPEPESWMMFLAAMPLLGSMRRRRCRQTMQPLFAILVVVTATASV